MPTALEKVRQLIELAAQNENLHEAGNSALQAVRLMKKHGLEVQEAFSTAVKEEFHSAVTEDLLTPEDEKRIRANWDRVRRGQTENPLKEIAHTIGDAAGRRLGRTVVEFFTGRRR